MIKLQDIITIKRELLSRETYSRNPINYSEDMADDQKERYIQYLAEQNQDLRVTKFVWEDFMAKMKEFEDRLASMQSKQSGLEKRLSEEHKLRKSAERKAKFLQEKLDFSNQERFGDRHQKIHSKAKKSDSDRHKEKDDYDDAGFTPKERFRERQSLETKELLIELRSLLDSELSKESGFRSQYYTKALDYLKRFWKEIFVYLDDGELPIGNNLAERTIRKLITQRNNSLHYGSDASAEMAVIYHSVIGMVKLHGSSIWNFIGTFFKNIFNVGAEITLTCFLTKFFGYQPMLNIQRGMP